MQSRWGQVSTSAFWSLGDCTWDAFVSSVVVMEVPFCDSGAHGKPVLVLQNITHPD